MTPEAAPHPMLPWSCDKCAMQGLVEIPPGTDVRAIPAKVFEAHLVLSTECHAKWGGRFVRVAQTAPIPD